ncbi:MAG: glycerol-3-phosphate 1-O-acyltransferase PlsY [Candidatus Acidiferrum sp.]
MHEISPKLLSVAAIAYLLGSIPFGLLLGKIFGGADVRQSGSGNIGATNVARVAGPAAGILTLLLDGAKGAVAVLLAARATTEGSSFFASSTWMMIAGFAALLGHCFPVWLRFRGGKGVATAAGIFLALSPPAGFGAIVVFILVVVRWGYVSLASIAAAAAMPLLVYLLWAPHHAPPPTVTFGALAAALLVVYKHDANIQRLVEGREPKISSREKSGAK